MSSYPNPFQQAQPLDYGRESTGVVARFMNVVYAWMFAGLAISGLVAWWVSSQQAIMKTIFHGSTSIILIVAEIALVIAISRAIQRISAAVATALFVLFAAVNGLALSVIFLAFPMATIGTAFAVTAGVFGIMSIVGFVTKTDLTKFGSLLRMALVGVVIASLVNLFMHSSGLQWIITYAAVFIFVGLTAYDTQKLKQLAYSTDGNPALANRLAIIGSLILYLDFINLFVLILELLGDRRN